MRASLLLPLLPLLLGSCSMLGSVISSEPAVDSAGPLVVGKTVYVSGVINGGTVSASVPVRQLVNVVNGRGTIPDYDRINSLQANTPGFTAATYTNLSGSQFINTSGSKLNIYWTGTGPSLDGMAPQYACTIDTFIQTPYTGVLLQRIGGGSNSQVYTGTCSVTIN